MGIECKLNYSVGAKPLMKNHLIRQPWFRLPKFSNQKVLIFYEGIALCLLVCNIQLVERTTEADIYIIEAAKKSFVVARPLKKDAIRERKMVMNKIAGKLNFPLDSKTEIKQNQEFSTFLCSVVRFEELRIASFVF